MSPDLTILEAELDDYRLSVMGQGNLWLWTVSLGDDDLSEGREPTMADAMAAAEAAVLAAPQPCPCCGR